jgi:hypothetical protein
MSVVSNCTQNYSRIRKREEPRERVASVNLISGTTYLRKTNSLKTKASKMDNRLRMEEPTLWQL